MKSQSSKLGSNIPFKDIVAVERVKLDVLVWSPCKFLESKKEVGWKGHRMRG